MLTIADLETLARPRLHEATALLIARQFDGSSYLGRYAVELILKARICVHLDWKGYPETRKEFEKYTSLRTHHLETLLDLTVFKKKSELKMITTGPIFQSGRQRIAIAHQVASLKR
ncbi:hypothetical protein [Massilia scottii]|uniref:hypothetical protein n=1 Tax=Massilia scottii TaxID=3057166 RepID=UPI002796D31B|nr:hypothetical protein [Massilia sp. CCM 9029]MDQ1832795.1 hypothetical protein [Massilia sp. CCM 9029]